MELFEITKDGTEKDITRDSTAETNKAIRNIIGIDFETLKEIPSTDIRAAESLKVEKERELNIPKSITARQARLALLQIGKLADVTAAISSLPTFSFLCCASMAFIASALISVINPIRASALIF